MTNKLPGVDRTSTPGQEATGLAVSGEGNVSPVAAHLKVVGIDLSLLSTGISDGRTYADRIEPKRTSGIERLRVIRDSIRTYCHGVDLVVVEGLAFHAYDAGSERAGLHWLIRERLDAWGYPVAIASPQAVKKYATGRGNAGKDEVLSAVIRRWTHLEVPGNDEADACVLASMGLDWLGKAVVVVPESHRESLVKIQWPFLVAA